ncbi:MAG TPA: UbiH/UbiF family hydroxylase [Thiobacillaceae bacterium]|nr:UbiH/UbiF family hydroxylase [Thiobacillaceae bacterium]
MRYHAVVVGAGLVGTACALALEQRGLQVAMIESRPPSEPAPDWDSRIYAISPASQSLLESLGVWGRMDSSRLQAVYRMDVFGDGAGVLRLDAYDSGTGRLATILESGRLQWALWQAARQSINLEILSPAAIREIRFGQPVSRLALEDGRELETELVIGADGRDSWVRAQAGFQALLESYAQLGVVANFAVDGRHQGTAFQWFRNDGVLAWLPLPGERMSMVWSTAEAHGRELLALDEPTLCARVAKAGQNRLGTLSLLTPAAAFPLRLMKLAEICKPGVALVGDAAHGVHPLAGQGVNLGFGDVDSLAAHLANRGRAGCGDVRILAAHARARAEPVARMQAVTDNLHDLFARTDKLSGTLRNAGMSLLNRLPVAKSALVREAMGITD